MERQNVNISQWLWWVERDSLLIAYWDSGSAEFTSPSEAKKVHILYIQRPDKFLVSGEKPERDGFTGTDEYLGVALSSGMMTDADMLNQECEIPEQFHETLINRVLANGYERQVETIQLSQHFHMKYEVGLKQARAYSFRGRDGSLITRVPVDF